MKNILVVDQNAKTVAALFRLLAAYQDLFKVFTAPDGQVAIDTIGNQEIDLVITELNLPRVNGIALIKHLLDSKSGIPIIVGTAYGTPEIELKLSSVPNIKYFSKPLNLSLVLETIFEKMGVVFGQVDGVGLSSFLQLLEMESKTCTLSIISKESNKTGTLYMVDGVLIAAETENKKNEAAAYEVLAWENAKIHIVYSVGKKGQKINQSLMNILMEGAKQKDEKEGKEPSAPASNDDAEATTLEQLMESGPMAEVLAKMKAALIKIIGPKGEIVFANSIAEWLEAIEPSMASLPSLIDILDQEINDPEKIAKYRALIETDNGTN